MILSIPPILLLGEGACLLLIFLSFRKNTPILPWLAAIAAFVLFIAALALFLPYEENLILLAVQAVFALWLLKAEDRT